MIPIYAWAHTPDFAAAAAFLAQHDHAKHIVFGLRGNTLPQWTLPPQPGAADRVLYRAWRQALRCTVFDAANCIADWLPHTTLWLLPESAMTQLHQHFAQAVFWQTAALPQQPPAACKPWLAPPPNPCRQPEQTRVLVIGAGIAGAATAYECARLGAQVTVLEAAEPASAASGNRQGLLYAKISAHHTAQTELLLSGYGYTRRLLHTLLPQSDAWHGCGVLHLNHNAAETERNRALARNRHYRHLYRPVSAAQASRLAGIPLDTDALFWRQGAWLNPATLIHALLRHPNITLHTRTPLQHAAHNGTHWQALTPAGVFSGDCIVFCVGADHADTAVINTFPMQSVRGQTANVRAVSGSLKLRTALSAASYISPAWQNLHCFGAGFIPNDTDSQIRAEDEIRNRAELAKLSPYLAQQFAQAFAAPLSGSLKQAHAAIRCDCCDHLPAVGALGDAAAMQQVYAKLAHDKNYRITTPCPYLPDAYTNTAHASRGLSTAPLCAADIAAQIFGQPRPLSARLQQALHPNRLIIRQITHKKAA